MLCRKIDNLNCKDQNFIRKFSLFNIISICIRMTEHGIVKKRVIHTILLFVITALLYSCDDGEDDTGSSYDPNLSVELETFYPDSGGIRTDFIITGSNFGSDISKIEVLFINDKSATVISANNETIYCLVPKQSDGDNSVKVIIDSDTTAFSERFHYTIKQSVSTITGVQGDNDLIDGSLSEARFNYIYGIAAVANGDIIACEMYAGNIRFVAVDNNEVTTLQTGFYTCQPVVSTDYKTVYAIGKNSPHKVYAYKEANLWEPELLISSISNFSGSIYSVALDKDERWLYFFDSSGKFGRLEIANPNNVEVLNESIPHGNGSHNCLAYSDYYDSFFYTIYSAHVIYKLDKDGKYEIWIGGNGGGITVGDRLESAKLYYPGGITVDSDGNIYWCNIDGNTIEKCDRKSGYVSLLAGAPKAAGHVDGDPLESKFYLPFGISIDEDGNYIISECYGSGVIRKLAIE